MGFLSAPRSLARHVWQKGDLIVQPKSVVPLPPASGSHALLIGTQGGAYGFSDGVFGDITPDTLEGLAIAYLQEAANILRLGFVGDAQLGAVTQIDVIYAAAGAQPIPLVWSSGVNAYVSAQAPDFEAWLSARVGQTVQINIQPVAASMTLDEQVEAILAGREGTAFDLGDNATRFTDSAATVPVTADGQAVQAVKSKWGSLAYTFSTANVANAPLAEADAILFDGVDDVLTGDAPSLGFLNSIPAATVGVSFKPSTVGTGNGTLLFLSRSTGSGINWLDLMRSTATLRFLSKRNGGDANAIFTSAAGTLAVGQQADALLESDFAGTGRMETWLDGSQLAGVDLGGTLGNSEALNSAGTALGAVTAASSRFFGSIRKVFLARFKLTPAEKATVQAWLEAA